MTALEFLLASALVCAAVLLAIERDWPWNWFPPPTDPTPHVRGGRAWWGDDV